MQTNTINSIENIGTLNRGNAKKITKELQKCSNQIMEFLPGEKKQEKNNTLEKINELENRLKQEISRKSEEIGYDYSEDYGFRLGQSDEVLKKVFERILSNDEKIRNIYGEILSLFPHTQDGKERNLYINYFENLVYESMNKPEYESKNEHVVLKRDTLKGYIDAINNEAKKGCKKISLSNINILDCPFDYGILKLVEFCGKKGVKLLYLGKNDLGKRLGLNGILQLVETAGNSGIKALYLWNNELCNVLSKNCIIKLVETSGNAGIKFLYLSGNDLGKYFAGESFLMLKNTALKSGIKYFIF